MKPTTDLITEHGPVKLMLRVLDKFCEKMDAGDNVDINHLEQAIVFIREFADKCHHGKEEDWLFPAMKKNNIPEEISLIDVLLEEHRLGRICVKNMAEAIIEKDTVKFRENARGYIKLLDPHIVKENAVLFPMANKSLSEAAQKELEKGFEDIEKNKIGEGRHQELHDIIHKLREIYL